MHDTIDVKADEMPSHFTSKMLKYLFILFGPDEVLPVDHYFITPGGHILTDRKVGDKEKEE